MPEENAPAFRNAKFEATGETREWYGRTLHRIRAVADIEAIGVVAGTLGGWLEREDNLSASGSVWIAEEVIACGPAKILGGTFEGGTFEGGTFRGGTFWGGTFWGGTFEGGTFRGGTFWGGTFRGGIFWNGIFEGGTFEGGTFEGGAFRGGTFRFALTHQRSDGYVFTVNNDGKRIVAGCRNFTWAEARAHWTKTRGGTQLGDESLLILDCLEAQAKLCGLETVGPSA